MIDLEGDIEIQIIIEFNLFRKHKFTVEGNIYSQLEVMEIKKYSVINSLEHEL